MARPNGVLCGEPIGARASGLGCCARAGVEGSPQSFLVGSVHLQVNDADHSNAPYGLAGAQIEGGRHDSNHLLPQYEDKMSSDDCVMETDSEVGSALRGILPSPVDPPARACVQEGDMVLIRPPVLLPLDGCHAAHARRLGYIAR